MKKSLLILLLLVSGRLLADEKGVEFVSFVQVVSDVADPAVPKGKCLVTGTVYYEINADAYNYINRPCDSLVSAVYKIGEDQQLQVDRKGKFSVMADTSDRYVSFMASQPSTEYYETVYLEHYPFQSGHRIEIAVYLPLKARQPMIIVDKPVIYAYSDREMQFSLQLAPKGELAFCYPALDENQSWKMKMDASGKMTDTKGLEIPYLFWEARQEAQSFASAVPSSEAIVTQNELLPYLEHSLSALGLNPREKTDFITYWCPRMLGHRFVEVKFYVDEQCSVIGDLNTEPRPDALRRVYATFHGMNAVPQNFVPKELTFPSFKRTGFVVLEWGGSELGNDELGVMD